ncbi:MAG: DNA repair protein RadC [Clostridiales Family XIII bacterium]|jgi:DNA repair protein RadC|nr:DNA repair protein RadC [Clostridiales Family XIII bacterium]
MPTIRELPSAERPREKLFRQGCKQLSNMELIALLIGSGTREANAITLAGRVLSATESGLATLKGASPEELLSVKGIGEASASRLLAAAELGARIASEQAFGRCRVLAPEDVYEMFAAEFCGEKQEIVTALLLNARHEVIGRETVSKGGVVNAQADPRDVFRSAVKRGATGVIVVHNHPSGDPSPSDDDLAATEKLEKAGELIGVVLIDHIIIGSGRHVSLRAMRAISK